MKKRLPILILLIAIFLITPLFVHADVIANAVKDLKISIIQGVMGFLVYLSGSFAQMTGALLDWVTSPDFISFSYTKSSGANANPIIAVGLNITKNFVNLGLVVVLIFIALSISLQIKDYGSKKILINLIIIALLVNFAPVLVGLIVDASNITMNFFLNGIENGISTALIDLNSEGLVDALTRPGSVTPFSTFTKGAVMIALYSSIGLAFLLMIFVFVLRYIMIWFLVILSPLAFVAWILPATKKFWTMWWNQLIQWSIIGIPMAFFLYLAARAVPEIKGRFVTQVVIPGAEQSIVGLVDQTFPYFVIIIFVYLGFFLGLKGGAAGSSMAINFAKRAPGRAWATTKFAGRGARLISRKAKLDQRRIVPWKGGAKSLREAGGVLSSKMEQTPGVRWFLPEKARLAAEYRPAVETAQAKAKKVSSMNLANRVFSGADIHEEALADILEMLDRNDGQDIFEGAKRSKIGTRIKKEKQIRIEKETGKKMTDLELKGLKVTDEELLDDKEFIEKFKRPMEIADQSGMLGGATLRKDPRLAIVAAKSGIRPPGKDKDGKEKPFTDVLAKYVGESRSQHIALWEPQVLENVDVVEACLAKFDRDRWLAVSRTIKDGQETAQKTMDKALSNFINSDPGLKLSVDSKKRSKEDIFNKEYKKHIVDKYGGAKFFTAMEDNRMSGASWRPGGTDIGWEAPKKEGGTTSPGESILGSPTPPQQQAPLSPGIQRKISGRYSDGKNYKGPNKKPPKGTRG